MGSWWGGEKEVNPQNVDRKRKMASGRTRSMNEKIRDSEDMK